MKNKLLLLPLFLLALNSCGISNYYSRYDDTQYHPLSINETYLSSSISLDVDWLAGNVNIKTDDSIDKIVVHESFTNKEDEYKARVLDFEDTLYIKYCASNVTLVDLDKKDLDIVIPTNYPIEDLSVDITSGSLSINGLTIKNDFNVDTVSANVKIENVFANNLDFDSTSGNLNLVESSIKNINCDTTSGNCYLKLSDYTLTVDIDAVSGNTIIDLVENNAGYDVDFSTQTGKFSSAFDNNYSFNHKNLKIDCDTVSGSLTINKQKND